MKLNNLLIPLIGGLLIFGSVKFAGSAINGLDPTLVRDLYLIERFQDDPSTGNINRLKACNLSLEDDPELGSLLLWNIANVMVQRARFMVWQLQRAHQRARAEQELWERERKQQTAQ